MWRNLGVVPLWESNGKVKCVISFLPASTPGAISSLSWLNYRAVKHRGMPRDVEGDAEVADLNNTAVLPIH